MDNMNYLFKKILLLILIAIFFIGLAEHTYLSLENMVHITQETNCPIHTVGIQSEETQSLKHRTTFVIGETKDNTHPLNLKNEISHPPTT